MNTLGEVFDNSTDAVFGIDASGHIRFTNSAFERLMGYTGKQLCSSQCADILCGTDLQGRAFCGRDCPIPKTVTDQPDISDFDIVVRHNEGDSMLVNIGASYVSSLMRESSGVDVLFSLRRVSSQRLLHRMTAPSGIGLDTRDALHAYRQLTKREKQVIDLAADGKSTGDIAGLLYISTQTVRSHFKNIYRKLGVSSRVEAVIVVMQCKANREAPAIHS